MKLLTIVQKKINLRYYLYSKIKIVYHMIILHFRNPQNLEINLFYLTLILIEKVSI